MYFNYGVNLGAKGVDLMVNVSAWPSESGDLYTQSAETTARACKCWHVVANQVGTVGYERYGHSRIIDADGTVIADTGSDEGMVIAQTGLFIDSGTLPSNRRP